MICHRLPTSGANGLDMTKRGGKGKVISIIPTNYISRVSDMSFFSFFLFRPFDEIMAAECGSL